MAPRASGFEGEDDQRVAGQDRDRLPELNDAQRACPAACRRRRSRADRRARARRNAAARSPPQRRPPPQGPCRRRPERPRGRVADGCGGPRGRQRIAAPTRGEAERLCPARGRWLSPRRLQLALRSACSLPSFDHFHCHPTCLFMLTHLGDADQIVFVQSQRRRRTWPGRDASSSWAPGSAGLVAALLMAARGYETIVLESAEAPGGKMREVLVGGRHIDAGPTVFTMRWVFDEIFDDRRSLVRFARRVDSRGPSRRATPGATVRNSISTAISTAAPMRSANSQAPPRRGVIAISRGAPKRFIGRCNIVSSAPRGRKTRFPWSRAWA